MIGYNVNEQEMLYVLPVAGRQAHALCFICVCAVVPR